MARFRDVLDWTIFTPKVGWYLEGTDQADTLYGSKASKFFPRQFLHAQRLGFKHPVDGRELSFGAPLPEDLTSALSALGS